jgi:hypothetical protein
LWLLFSRLLPRSLRVTLSRVLLACEPAPLPVPLWPLLKLLPCLGEGDFGECCRPKCGDPDLLSRLLIELLRVGGGDEQQTHRTVSHREQLTHPIASNAVNTVINKEGAMHASARRGDT